MNKKTFPNDLLASIVVFLVALPLCMGVAIASGVPVSAGLFTGIIAGIVVGTLAGCPLQVSGPAAGLAVIVFGIVQRFGLELLGIVVLLAGLMQIAAGLLKLGQWFRAVSPAVIKGMLAGIGVIIFVSQFHIMLDARTQDSTLANITTMPESVVKAFTQYGFANLKHRAFRLEHLRSVGKLRKQQVSVSDRVTSLLPIDETDPAELASDLEQQLESRLPALKAIAEDQQEIADQLDRLSDAARESERGLDTERSSKIVAAIAATDRTMEIAVNDLDSGDLLSAVQSQAALIESFDEYLASLKNHGLAAQLGLLTIVIIVLWPIVVRKKLKAIPGPLVAALVATTIAVSLTLPVVYVDVPNNLFAEMNFPRWELVRQASWVELLSAAAGLAAVASAETLLCATATDRMHSGPRTKYNRELFAQGVGNTLCGFVGALPLAGVIVRSTANVEADGKTRLSAIMHGFWLLLFVALLTPLLRVIPTSSLAAILVYTGYRLFNPRSIRELAEFGWSEVAIFAITVLTIVSVDLLTGIITGVILALVQLLYRFSRLGASLRVHPQGGRATLVLSGAATFLGLPRLASKLEEVPAEATLEVHFHDLDYIDHACIDLLSTWSEQHRATGGDVMIDWRSLQEKYEEEATTINSPQELAR